MWLSSIRDGAEAQFVQCSTALFEFSGTAGVISAPSCRGHSHSSLLWTGDSTALINPLKLSLKIVCRWIAFCTEGEEGSDWKVCCHVHDPRHRACTPAVSAEGNCSSPFTSSGCHVTHSVCLTVNAQGKSCIEPWVTVTRSLAWSGPLGNLN